MSWRQRTSRGHRGRGVKRSRGRRARQRRRSSHRHGCRRRSSSSGCNRSRVRRVFFLYFVVLHHVRLSVRRHLRLRKRIEGENREAAKTSLVEAQQQPKSALETDTGGSACSVELSCSDLPTHARTLFDEWSNRQRRTRVEQEAEQHGQRQRRNRVRHSVITPQNRARQALHKNKTHNEQK